MQLHNIIFNNLRRCLSKMFFMLIGIVIGIATMVSVYNVIQAMQAQMTKQVSEFGVNVIITPDSGGLTFSYGGIILPEILYDVEQLTNEDVETIENLESKKMIRIAAPKLISVETLNMEQTITVIGANLRQEFQIKPWLTIRNPGDLEENVLKTFDKDEMDMDYTKIDLNRQDLDLVDIKDNQVIVGNVLAKSLNIMEGDIINLSGNELEVVSILAESGESEDNQILMNLASAQTLLNKPEEITEIDISVDYNAGSEEVLLREIADKVPKAQVTSLRQETLRKDEMLGRIIRFGVAISILIFFIGILVVGITMSGSVRERTREIGIFRALGFRKAHIIKIILSEAVIMCFLGGLFGYIAGNLVSSYAIPLFIGEVIPMGWNGFILLGSIGISVMIGLVSGIVPALRAARLDPVEALRFI